jgi:hypothetical protein
MVPWSELEPDQAETLLAVLLYNEHRRAVHVRASPSRSIESTEFYANLLAVVSICSWTSSPEAAAAGQQCR